jgi:hypothetical protein
MAILTPHPVDRIVQALEAIKLGVSDDQRQIAAILARLEPPQEPGAPPRAQEVERFRQALDKIGPASWLMIAMTAAEAGYYLPSSLDRMAGITTEAAAGIGRRRRSCALAERAVAGSCAAVYFDLAHEAPPIVNYRQLGGCNRYGRLVEAVFAAHDLPGWSWAAEEAARELRAVLPDQYKRRRQK